MTSIKQRQSNNLREIREAHSSSTGIFFKEKKSFYRKKSAFQNIEVFENDYFGRVLLLDGLVQTTDRDEFFYHEMLVHPALVTHPSPENGLVIGGGDGGALKEILRYPLNDVCLVEIDPQVIEVSKKYFPWLSLSLEDERSELIIADGSKYIKETNKTFDVIFIDSSEPVGPSSPLHEKHFYMDLKSCLKEKGIVVAQVGSLFYHLDSIKKKAAFLKNCFNFVNFYTSPVPTYPGGYWCYVFLSDEIRYHDIKRKPRSGLQYYNPDIHNAAFALPNFVKNILS